MNKSQHLPPREAADLRPAALVVDGVSKAYGAIRAVADISLAMATDEIVALVGHSGSGKSTLLRLVAGLERPTAGTIAIGGHAMSGAGAFVPPERRGVGMIFQDYALFPHLTAIENVRFGLSARPRREAADHARAALDRVGLAARADAYPHTLSGGEQQRVALARALAPEPSLLLMDEPFSNLDRRTRDIVRDETTALLRDVGTAAILVTHDPEDAMRMAGRIMLMQAGRIVQGGTAEELYRHPASLLVARFFADYNEIDAVCRGGAVETPLGRFPAEGISEGQRTTVCVRPHDLRLGNPSRVAGTITSRAFVGDELVLTVAVPGLSRPLQLRAPAHAEAMTGQHVGIVVDAGDVLVFPSDS